MIREFLAAKFRGGVHEIKGPQIHEFVATMKTQIEWAATHHEDPGNAQFCAKQINKFPAKMAALLQDMKGSAWKS